MALVKLISVCGTRKFYKQVEITPTDEGTLRFEFPYDEYLKNEVKMMAGARWNPDQGCWTVLDCPRNWFQISYLKGENPYSWFDRSLIEFTPRIKTLYPQQYKMAQEGLTYRQVIWAAEMGLGKTLSAIETIEHAAEMFDKKDWWWVGPKSALASFDVEVDTWGMKCYPNKVMTYEELVKVIKKWPPGLKAPQGVVFDESSRAKTLTAQRTQACQSLADGMREDHGDNEPFIILMTGSPAPKSPLDWYSQCEIAKPGFLREGTIHKFRDTLATVVKKENTTTGGIYPQVLNWKDNEDRCKICGCIKETHDFDLMAQQIDPHNWEKGVNEVARLYKRMKGLVSVYFKKEWLTYLPEKQYRILRCKVSRATQNAARAIESSAKSAVQALILMRELSDGFLYSEEVEGTTRCELCKGTKITEVPFVDEEQIVRMIEVECSMCNGTGEVPRTIRTVDSIACPKDTLLEEILDDHEDGRLVTYGGFTGTIDRIVEVAKRKSWEWIRVDGRGWHSSLQIEATRKDLPKLLLNNLQHQMKSSIIQMISMLRAESKVKTVFTGREWTSIVEL